MPATRVRGGSTTRGATTDETLVREHTLYSCVMGSRAFGLATEDSDTDIRGVFLAPTHLFWSFDKPPTHVEGPAPEQFSWELERFCSLALPGSAEAACASSRTACRAVTSVASTSRPGCVTSACSASAFAAISSGR